MKNILSLVFFLVFGMAMAQTKTKSAAAKVKPGASSKHELARLIRTRVVIRDTTKLQTIASGYDPSDPISYHISNTYINYLEPSYFYEFIQGIYSTMRLPGALLFSSWDLKKPLSPAEVKNRYVMCDSIQESTIDTEGNEIITLRFRCDSTSRIENITAVDFYETWYFNETSRMIEKDVLAYEVLSYLEDKQAYLGLFMVVKDEEARKKLVKLYFGN